MKKLFTFAICLILSGASFSQISVTNTQTPVQLVQNVLLGFGVTASNISVNGSPLNANNIYGNVTFFDDNGTTFPIPSGVLLTSGNGIAAVGPNTSGSFTNNNPVTTNVSSDPHLTAIANGTVTNGIVLEFDFVPAGDTISFNYLFGSDEYPEFSPSSFNDAFGFFLWGPGISGPYTLAGYPAGGANLAVLPGTTTPVTINNVGPTSNPAYYVDNQAGAAYGNAIQYDGTTTLLSANASVQCGQTYHIKLCISNVGDQSYDSGVFLQANSFSSEAVEIAVATVSGDTSIYEGCSDAELMFIRPQTQIGDTLILDYTIGGTATMGSDYNNIPNPITFLPGDDTISVVITPIADGIPDNNEYITITATTISECGDTIVSTGTLYILDSIDIPINAPDPLVQCIDDSVMIVVSASGFYPPYTYDWSDGQTGDTVYLPTVTGSLTGSVDYYVTVTNSCGYSNVDTVTITLNQTLSIDTVISYPSSACIPNGAVSAMVSGQTGVPYYNWSGPGPNSPNSYDATVWQNISPGWYYFMVEDNVCTAFDSVYVDPLNPPIASLTASPSSGCAPVNVTFTNSSQNATSFEWQFGNGDPNVNTSTMDPQSATYTTTATAMLVAFDMNNCSDTAYATINVVQCGCTDPFAMNYDPSAVIDDGSCLYPTPTVEGPNVFTPNGDGTNDAFFLNAENTIKIDLTITNRWGNVMYESTMVNPQWDGKLENGEEAAEGVYFYRYKAYGLNDTIVEGHGFFHLVRD